MIYIYIYIYINLQIEWIPKEDKKQATDEGWTLPDVSTPLHVLLKGLVKTLGYPQRASPSTRLVLNFLPPLSPLDRTGSLKGQA